MIDLGPVEISSNMSANSDEAASIERKAPEVAAGIVIDGPVEKILRHMVASKESDASLTDRLKRFFDTRATTTTITKRQKGILCRDFSNEGVSAFPRMESWERREKFIVHQSEISIF